MGEVLSIIYTYPHQLYMCKIYVRFNCHIGYQCLNCDVFCVRLITEFSLDSIYTSPTSDRPYSKNKNSSCLLFLLSKPNIKNFTQNWWNQYKCLPDQIQHFAGINRIILSRVSGYTNWFVQSFAKRVSNTAPKPVF